MVRGGTFVQLTTFILILGLGDVGADPCRGFTTDGWTPGGGGGGVVPHLVQVVAAEVEAGVVEVQHPEVMVGAAGVVGAAEVQAQVLP